MVSHVAGQFYSMIFNILEKIKVPFQRCPPKTNVYESHLFLIISVSLKSFLLLHPITAPKAFQISPNDPPGTEWPLAVFTDLHIPSCLTFRERSVNAQCHGVISARTLVLISVSCSHCNWKYKERIYFC